MFGPFAMQYAKSRIFKNDIIMVACAHSFGVKVFKTLVKVDYCLFVRVHLNLTYSSKVPNNFGELPIGFVMFSKNRPFGI
jgi:hypothetical protein